ncbi:uncharacterized protein LOC114260629 isoform X2 [Camellia sinensis]|uniref:uncharacterized protein LOC114260629 isoform X2 n=1 Tax=Camellia sinensis TaxID=4442 RepID=UPI00103624DE|nr:uncharacterized protein LOC114260629 isoform X2 [Camellia sinensis]XP_028056582.1 uncharacterized protein LOC114260629 isoform X2 [Camellia sinensis]
MSLPVYDLMGKLRSIKHYLLLDQGVCAVDTKGTAISWSSVLCRSMLKFINSLLHYLTFEVLEPNWHVMHNRLQTAKSIDDVIEYHNFFFENCLRECLLLLSEVLKIPHVVLGKKVGNTGVIAAIQLSTKHNATIEATRHELKALHPNDPQIVVLNQAWSLESKRHYSSSSFFYHENLLIEP